MKSRLVMLMSLGIAALSIVMASGRFSYTFSPPPPVHAKLKPASQSYLGVYESGPPPTYAAVASFAQVAGRLPNLAGYYSGWAELFDLSLARSLHDHAITPLVQIDPADASVGAIADGTYDNYLEQFADSVRSFGHPVVIGFGHEMNSPGYSWGYGHVPAAVFVRAWRHMVTVFRQQGADNVEWLWTVQADRPGTGPIRDWWPGSGYVDWVGIDGFYYQPSDTFNSVFSTTINQVRTFTTKPILLAETAVGPRAGQFSKILNLFKGLARVKALGLVWFDIAQNKGLYHQDWRLENDGPADNAFRLGVREDLTG